MSNPQYQRLYIIMDELAKHKDINQVQASDIDSNNKADMTIMLNTMKDRRRLKGEIKNILKGYNTIITYYNLPTKQEWHYGKVFLEIQIK